MDSRQERTGRHLLERLRELADPARPERADLDAAVEFLRYEAVPYLRLGGPTGPSGASGLAAIADEAQALGRLADAAGPHGLAAADERARAEALRRLGRVEERLAESFGDESGAGPAGQAAPTSPTAEPQPAEGFLARFRRSREMTAEEVRAFVESHSWAVLATVRDDAPYAVPIIYGFDGERFYSVSGPGTKASNIDGNANVCLTITDVVDGGEWSSVVVMGRARWVGSMAGRFAAVVALRRQRSIPVPATLQDALRLARARVLQLVPATMTGRTTRPAD